MGDKDFASVPVMWTPKESYGKEMRKFQKIVEDKYKVKFNNYWEFHKWSVENLVELWTEIWEISGLVYSKKYEKIVDPDVPISDLPIWFEGAKLNFAENVLKYKDDGIAIIAAGEDRETIRITYSEMYQEVKLYAAALRKAGIKKGDVVVCHMSNREEAMFAGIAVASIGAVWTGALPQMGAEPVLRRFQQMNPKIYLTIDRFPHGGHDTDMLPKIKEITHGLPTLEKVIIVASKEESYSKDISGIKNSCFLKDFLESGRDKDGSVPELTFEQVSFQHPVFIVFTSGTTGLPKALVHGCGVLLSVVQYFRLHTDCTRESVWFTIVPEGWGIWRTYLTQLSRGSTISVFEGYPYFLGPNFYWNLIEEHRITHIFVHSGVLEELQKRKIVPTKENLKHLKFLMAGSSVVKPEVYDFMYQLLENDIPFASSFGASEFNGTPMLLDGNMPIHKGEIPVISLGFDTYTVNNKGERIVGELGELVLAKPIPNLPLGLWKDTDNSIYKETYFSKYPEKFAMGDNAIINPGTNGIKICCRSDETLNQRGMRFGSSEIYSVLNSFPEVRDSICVSKYSKKMDESAVLFLKMSEGYKFSEELVNRIRKALTEALSAYFVPDIILETKDIPYSINCKKMEITVKKIINNMPYNADSIRNPQCLKDYCNIPELQMD